MAVAITQSKTLIQGTAAISHPITFTSPTTAGCAVLIIWRIETTGAVIGTSSVTISDNNSGVYSHVGSLDTTLGGYQRIGAHVASNLGGRSGHIVTLAVNPAVYCAAKIYELSGVPTSELVAGVVAMNLSNTTTADGSDLVPNNNGLAFGAVTYNGVATTITSGWTGGTQDDELDESSAISGNLNILRKAVTAGTTEKPAWTFGAARIWAFIAFVIRESGTVAPTSGVVIRQSHLLMHASQATPVAIRFNSATSAGCAVLVLFRLEQSSAWTTLSVTDNNSGSYSMVAEIDFGASLVRLGAYLAVNLAGRQNHLITLTPAVAAFPAIAIYELTGVPASSLLTGTPITNNATGTAVTSGSVTPAEAGLHFAAMAFVGTGTVVTNWSGGVEDSKIDENNTQSGMLAVQRKAAVASSAQNAGWTINNSRVWAALNLAVKETAVVAAGQPTMRRWGGVPTMLGGQLIGRTW